jgi:integrase
MKSKYTIPKINKSSKYWYAHFRYEGVQFRYTWLLNKIENLKERESSYNDYIKILLDDLKKGWNPNIPDEIQMQEDMYFVEALRFALEKKKDNISKKTHSGYEGTINYIEKSVKLVGMDYLKIVDAKRAYLKLIMEKCKSENKWTNKSYNKHLNHLKAVLSELIQWEVIENNPAFNIKNLTTEESIAHVPPTDQEMNIIKTELKKNHPNFYNYISVIFHLGIRPEEILKIRLSMVDMDKNVITLPPNITKNRKKYRIMPINKHLKRDLETMSFRELPKDYFLFGSFKEAGLGNRGKNQFLPDFIPGPTHTNRDTATRRWESVVKIGLKIDCTMYSIKKYGANKKASAGISTEAIQGVFGHSEKETTLIYLTNQDEINRKEVMDNSPDF